MENIMNNRVYYYVVNLDNYDFSEFGFYTYNGEDVHMLVYQLLVLVKVKKLIM